MQDVLILGGGPAGVSAAIYARRAGYSVTIIAHGNSALEKTAEIENYYGFEEPISGNDLLTTGERQAKRLGIGWNQDEIVGIEVENDKISAAGLHKNYEAKAMILATGATRAIPKMEGLHQHEGSGVSYCAICDAFFYRGKEVAVLGNGQYALHEAADLLPVAKTVTLLTNGLEIPKELPEGLQVDERKIKAIMGKDAVEAVAFEDGEPLSVSGIFIALGVAGSDALAKKMGILTNGNRIVVDENMATNVPGVFAAGDCTGGLKQIVKAVHEGAVAGMSVTAFLRGKKE